MKPPQWLLRETVVILHEQLVAEFGGSAELRDSALLDSALAKPQNRFAYGEPSHFDLAASYASGLIRNHPFADGNKRIGFASAVLFLELNGFSFQAGEVEALIQILGLAAGKITEAGYASWLKANSAPFRGRGTGGSRGRSARRR